MMLYSFSLILAGVTDLTEEQAEELFEAGCDDCTPSVRASVVCLDFDRERTKPEEAIESAIRAVTAAGFTVERIEPDDLVTQAEIARRLERSREAIRLYVEGLRGPGDFPRPVAAATSTSPLWSWLEVARWAVKNKLLSASAASWAELINQTNMRLNRKHHHRRLPAISARL
jgi:hypothetical protein